MEVIAIDSKAYQDIVNKIDSIGDCVAKKSETTFIVRLI